MRTRWTVATVVALVLLAGTLSAQRYNPLTGGSEFPRANRPPVAVPGAPECTVTVEFWENGSFLERVGGVDMRRPMYRKHFLTVGATAPAPPGSANDADMVWVRTALAAALQHSPDMRTKTRDACAVTGGQSGVQVRLVRDDPNVHIAGVPMGTNLILMDVGDIQKLLAQPALDLNAVPAADRDDVLQTFALKSGRDALLFSILAHEMDHLRERGDGKHLDPPLNRDPSDPQGGAVRDENQVLRELGLAVQRPFYQGFNAGWFGIEYEVAGTRGARVFFNPVKALGPAFASAAGEGREGRFVWGNVGRLEQIPSNCCDCSDAPPAAPGKDCFESARLEYLTNTVALRRRSDWWRDPAFGGLWQQPLAVQEAKVETTHQRMGGSVLGYTDHTVVIANSTEEHRDGPGGRAVAWRALQRRLDWQDGVVASWLGWWVERPPAAGPQRRPSSGPARSVDGAPPMIVLTSLGASSGEAFTLTVVHEAAEPLVADGDGFVLEPLAGVRTQEVERELSRLKGRRATATLTAYCLEMMKPPPVAGMLYRLVPEPEGGRSFPDLAPIMRASRTLKDAGRLHPDSDPEEYFHFIRQWALWAKARRFADERAFGEALIEHTRKSFESARQPFTPQVEETLRRIAPGRWRDILQVNAEADRQAAMRAR